MAGDSIYRSIVSTLSISRKALLGPKDCQQEGVMSKGPFLKSVVPRTTSPEVTLMGGPTRMGLGVARVAGRGLTIAAQAA